MNVCDNVATLVTIVCLVAVSSTDGKLDNMNDNRFLSDNAAVNNNDSFVNADQCTNADLVRTSIGEEPKCCAKDYRYIKEKCACVKCLTHFTNCCPSTYNNSQVDLRISSCETISAKCVTSIPPQVVTTKPDNSTTVETSNTESTTKVNVSTEVITQTTGTNAKHESWWPLVAYVVVAAGVCVVLILYKWTRG